MLVVSRVWEIHWSCLRVKSVDVIGAGAHAHCVFLYIWLQETKHWYFFNKNKCGWCCYFGFLRNLWNITEGFALLLLDRLCRRRCHDKTGRTIWVAMVTEMGRVKYLVQSHNVDLCRLTWSLTSHMVLSPSTISRFVCKSIHLINLRITEWTQDVAFSTFVCSSVAAFIINRHNTTLQSHISKNIINTAIQK